MVFQPGQAGLLSAPLKKTSKTSPLTVYPLKKKTTTSPRWFSGLPAWAGFSAGIKSLILINNHLSIL